MKAWYCAYTQPRMELWARANLWERGLEVYLPLYRKRRSHARRVDWVSAPLFPRYLFVEADLEAGERPATVAPGIIAELRGREDANGHVDVRPSFAPGEAVRVSEGALLNQVGLFQGLDDESRVVVLLTLLNRPVPVRLPAHAVRREG